MTHSPRSSATTVPIFCPSAVIVTVARGTARPAMTVPPSGFTRTMSKLGRIGGGGAGAALPPVGAAVLAVWLAAGAAADDVAGAVVDAGLEPAAAVLPELPFEGVVAVVPEGAVGSVPALWPLEPALAEGWLVVPRLVVPWVVVP